MSVSKVFLDSDIILDLLLEREPYQKPAASIFNLAEQNSLQLYTSTVSFANVYYLVRKKHEKAKTKLILQRFKLLVSILPTFDKTIAKVLSSEFSDIEDAIQYFTAIESNIHTLLTRNIKDYKVATDILVISAEDFLKQFYGSL